MKLCNLSVLILGGDHRIIYLANILSDFNQVYVYGLESEELNKNIKHYNLEDKKFDIVIGPVPTIQEKVNLFSPTISNKISLIDILKYIKTKIFIGCKLSEEIISVLDNLNIEYVDILDRDDFAIANALPTAEGAIKIAIENTPYILSGSKCLVLGYGRCGKVLAEKLKAIGANVSVEARKTKDIEYIKCSGYKPVELKNLKFEIGKYDIIFNTIPYLILDKETLQLVNKESLIIDLASRPGGTDFAFAKSRGIKTIFALGLPGKCAPKTAAEIIIRCIDNYLEELPHSITAKEVEHGT